MKTYKAQIKPRGVRQWYTLPGVFRTKRAAQRAAEKARTVVADIRVVEVR
jgi:hypothetical protein